MKLYYVALNEIPFIQGETINGFNASNEAITGIIDDATSSVFLGSKVITDQFTLEAGQRTNFYDVSKLTRLSSSVAPTRRLLIIFDYLIHASSGDYFSSNLTLVLLTRKSLNINWMVLLSLLEIKLISAQVLRN